MAPDAWSQRRQLRCGARRGQWLQACLTSRMTTSLNKVGHPLPPFAMFARASIYRTIDYTGCHRKFRSLIAHEAKKPRALAPRGNPRLPATARTSRRTAARALQARARPSASAHQPSMLRTRNSHAQPCTNSQHIAHPVQRLPSIPSLRIAKSPQRWLWRLY